MRIRAWQAAFVVAALGFVYLLYRSAVRWPGRALRPIGHYAWVGEMKGVRTLTVDGRAGADVVLYDEPIEGGGARIRLDGGTVTVTPATGSASLHDGGTWPGVPFAIRLRSGDHVVRREGPGVTERTVSVGTAAQIDVIVSASGVRDEHMVFVPLGGEHVQFETRGGVTWELVGCREGSVRLGPAGWSDPGCGAPAPPGIASVRPQPWRCARAFRWFWDVFRCGARVTDGAGRMLSFRWAESQRAALVRDGPRVVAEGLGLPGAVLDVPGMPASVVWDSNRGRRDPTAADGPRLVLTDGAARLAVRGRIARAPDGRIERARYRARRWLERLLRIDLDEPDAIELIPLALSAPTRGLDNGPTDHLLLFGDHAFAVQTTAGLPGPIVAMYRTPAPDTRFRMLLASSRDSAAYVPHRAVEVPPCETGRALVISVSDSPPREPEADRLRLPRPAWLVKDEPATETAVCFRNVGDYLVWSRAPDGLLWPQVLGALRNGYRDEPGRAKEAGTLTVRPGEALMIGGQVLAALPIDPPRAFDILRVTATVAILLAAFPLLIPVLATFVEDRHRWRSEPLRFLPRGLRFLVYLGPLAVSVAVVVTMMIGLLFQVRLAASSDLIGAPTLISQFVIGQVLALAICAGLVARRLGRTDGLGPFATTGASLTLGLAMVFWIDPLLMWWFAHSPVADRRLLPTVPATTWYLALPLAPILLLRLVHWLSTRRHALRQLFTTVARVPGLRTILSWLGWIGAWLRRVATSAAPWVSAWFGDTLEGPDDVAVRSTARIALRSLGNLLALCAWALIEVAPWLAGLVALQFGARVLLPVYPSWKELLGPLVAVLFIGMLGRLRALSDHQDASAAARSGIPSEGMLPAGALAVLAVFLLVLVRVPRLGFAPELRWVLALHVAAAAVLLFRPTWYPGATFPRAFVAYVIALTLPELFQGELGELMVWVPVLVAALAIVALAQIFLPLRPPSWPLAAGHLVTVILAMLLPATLLAHFLDRIDWVPGWLSLFDRARTRFELVRAPFYHDNGDWLTGVRWMASNVVGDRDFWLPNLNSDVAFYALVHHYPVGAAVVFLTLVVMVGMLACAAWAAFYTASRRQPVTGAAGDIDRIRASLLDGAALAGTALTALCMQVLVHLAMGALDGLPVTGVAYPWLSHGGSTSLVFTSVVVLAVTEVRTRIWRATHGS